LSSHREFPTPPQWRGEFGGGVNTPNFRTSPPASGERMERAEGEGGRKGRGEEKGRDPQGLVDTPMFQILKNTPVKPYSKVADFFDRFEDARVEL